MTEFTGAIKERMNNSFSGPYTLFFAVLNWPVMLFIFTGEDSAQTRIENVSSQLAADGWFTILNPLIATIAYILIVPHIVSLIDLYRTWVQSVKDTRVERINLKHNGTWEYKFSLVKLFAEKIMLHTNSMLANSRFDLERAKGLQRYVNALLEADNKSLNQHFNELRQKDLV